MSTSANFILPRNFLQWFVLFPSSHSKNFIGLIPLPVLGGQTLPERSENVKSLFSKRFLSTLFCSVFKSDSLSPRRRARSLTKLGRLQPTRSTWLWLITVFEGPSLRRIWETYGQTNNSSRWRRVPADLQPGSVLFSARCVRTCMHACIRSVFRRPVM